MLKLMRDNLKHLKWVLIFVVVVFVFFVFAEWGASGLSGGGATAGFAARVNRDVVSLAEYQRTMALTEQRFEQAYGQRITEEMRNQLDLPRQVLNSLVEQRLLLQEARRLDLEPTPEELRQRILEIPVLNPGGQFVGEELYARFVTAQLGYPNTSAFERELARDLTIAKLDSAIFNSVAIPAASVEREYRRRNESARIRYVLAPADRFLDQVQVSPEEVEAFYRANTGRYSHPEQRRIDYLLADESRIRSQINPDDAELRRQYQANREQYQTPEQVSASHILLSVPAGATPSEEAAIEQQARELVAKLRAGADFAALAREHSADPGSAANGGSLGFFGRGMMVSEFEDAAFSQPVGQIGDAVRTQFGFHIIRVDERREPATQPFEEVKDQLRQSVVDERARSQARDRLAQIRARLEQQRPINSQKLAAAADNFVSHNTSPFFHRTGNIEGLGAVPELSTWAFRAEEGELGPIINTPEGPVVPWVRQSRPAGVTPLDEIRARVENDARRDKATGVASDRLKAAQQQAGGLDAAGASLDLNVREGAVRRDGSLSGVSGDLGPIVDAAFQAQPGQLAGPFTTPEGALLIEVVEQQKFDPAKFAEERGSLEESMRRSEAMRLRTALLDRLRRNARVELNPDLIGTPAPGQPLG